MKARILVVDDDEALAEMIGIVLRNDGFEPVFCADGGQALEVFRSAKPDLVLLDLMLPGIDGIEVCRQIRAESDVPIVMLTAKADTSDVVRGLESGADDYVPKPFNRPNSSPASGPGSGPATRRRRRPCALPTSPSTWRDTSSAAAPSASR
jgi:DNA-binding response OmpR family regulator